MSLFLAWIAFPAVLGLLALGCGLLLERTTRTRLPGALVLPSGLAVIVVAGQVALAADATAELAVPLIAALAVGGFVLSPPWRRGRIQPWIAAAAVAVFALYAAPVVLSGQPTFPGYIKLDDTATWLAITDRMMEHGRSLDGLAPSTYEVVLEGYLGFGYPLGSFLAMGIGGTLLATDVAWLIHPSMAFFAAMLALALSELVRPLVAGPIARAAVAAVAAQPALLYGYVMWGGVKEIAAAATLALIAALAPPAIGPGPLGAVVPLAIACAALLAILGPAGAPLIAPMLLAMLVLAAVRVGFDVVARALLAAGVVGALSIPLVIGGAFDAATNPVLYGDEDIGNLFGSLSAFQAVGIWPAGDFRVSPDEQAATVTLIAVAIAAGLVAIALAVRQRAIGLLLFSLGGIAGGAMILSAGGAWVGAKALAMVAPAVLVLALAGTVVLWARWRRPEGLILALLVAFGVLWSNGLAYREVNLAPYDRLSELEEIGERIAGQGPALMTEYEPYGVRHFLRDADPEGVSELRRRTIPLRDGGLVPKGVGADTDALDPEALLRYRTLVVERSPERSRPPSPYRLIDRGRFYDVWQRQPGAPAPLERLPLGEGAQPAAPVPCDQVRRLAEAAGPEGWLAYARRSANVVVSLSDSAHPPGWGRAESTSLFPDSPGTATLDVELPRAGAWQAWLGGSVQGRIELWIDGREVGSERHVLAYDGYLRLGAQELEAGRHRVELRYGGADLHPGSAGPSEPIGPLVLSREEAGEEVVRLPAARFEELCGSRLDWIEAVPE